MKCHVFAPLVLLLLFYEGSESCSFPSALTGSWKSSDKGTLTFNSTHFGVWAVGSLASLTFVCHEDTGTYHVARSTGTVTRSGYNFYAYLCFRFIQPSANVFKYNLASTQLSFANNERVKFFQTSTTVSSSQVCDYTSFTSTSYDVLILASASASDVQETCPDDLQATWSYTLTSSGVTYCSSASSLDVCTDTGALHFNLTYCSTIVAYSSGGALSCIVSTTSGSYTYTTLYNHDASPDQSTTYSVTCLVWERSGDQLLATQYPKHCLDTQTPTSVSSPGAVLVLTSSSSCPAGADTTIIAVAATFGTIAGIFAVAALGIAIFVLYQFISEFMEKRRREERTRGDAIEAKKNEDSMHDVTSDTEKDADVVGNGWVRREEEVRIMVERRPATPRESECPGPAVMEDSRYGCSYFAHRGTEEPSLTMSLPPLQSSGGEPDRSKAYISTEAETADVADSPSPHSPDMQSSGPPEEEQLSLSEAMARAQASRMSGRLKALQRSALGSTPEENEIEGSSKSVDTPRARRNSFTPRPRRVVPIRARVVKTTEATKPKPRRTRSKLTRDPKESGEDDEVPLQSLSPVRITKVDMAAVTPTPQHLDDLHLEDASQDDASVTAEGDDVSMSESVRLRPKRRRFLQELGLADDVWGNITNVWRVGQTWADKVNHT